MKRSENSVDIEPWYPPRVYLTPTLFFFFLSSKGMFNGMKFKINNTFALHNTVLAESWNEVNREPLRKYNNGRYACMNSCIIISTPKNENLLNISEY